MASRRLGACHSSFDFGDIQSCGSRIEFAGCWRRPSCLVSRGSLPLAAGRRRHRLGRRPGDPRRIEPPHVSRPRFRRHRLRRRRRWPDRLQAGVRQGDRRLQRGRRRTRRRAGGRLARAAGRSISRAMSICTSQPGATVRFSTDPADYLPAVLTRFEGNEVMNYSPLIYAYRRRRTSRSPARARSTARPAPKYWWPWKGIRQRATRTRCGKWAKTTCPPPSASSARTISCGPTSSSPTAAKTCSSKASRSPIRRCGSSTRCSARTSPSAASRSTATARTTTAATPSRAATC